MASDSERKAEAILAAARQQQAAREGARRARDARRARAGNLAGRILGALGTVLGLALVIGGIAIYEDGHDAGNLIALVAVAGGLVVLLPSAGLLITGELRGLSL